MSSPSTPLDSLAVIPPCKGLTELYTDASKSLDIINLWKQASTNNAKFQGVINKVQDHSVIYFDALNTSITTATDGLMLSIEIIDLYPFLLKKDIEPEDLKELLSKIRAKTQKAHSDSKRTLEKFRQVREYLNKIIASLPKDPTDKEASKSVKFFNKLWPFGRDVKYEEAIEELRSWVDTLASLSESVDNFCEWLGIIEGRLIQAERRSVDLKKSNRINSVKVEQMETTWGQVRDDYQQYRNQIMKLQDRYPSQIEGRDDK